MTSYALRQFPESFDPDSTTLLCIPCDLFEIILGKIAELERPDEWANDSDWAAAYPVIAELQECAMACGTNITNRLDRIIAALGYAAGLEPTNPAYDATDTQRAAIERVRAGMSASGTITLDDVIQYINQLETYVYGLVDVIGDHTLDPPAPGT